VWENDKLLPGTTRTFRFDVQIQAPGEAKVYWHLVSADGAEFEETTHIQVSRDSGDGNPP